MAYINYKLLFFQMLLRVSVQRMMQKFLKFSKSVTFSIILIYFMHVACTMHAGVHVNVCISL